MRCKGVPAYAQSASDGIWGNSQINAICLDFPGISANALGLVAATVSSLNRHLFFGVTHMQATTRALTAKQTALAPLATDAMGAPTQKHEGGGRLLVGILALLVFAAGAGAGYLAAFLQFDEKIAAITQADELRINAKNDRIKELEEQQRESARHADEQERELEQQASAQERALLSRADERERKLAKPDLPIRVWVRKAFANNSIIARMHNFGEKELVLAVTAHNRQTEQRSTWSVAIAPSATQVIGREQGWTFAAGDEIDLVGNGYRPMNFRVPSQVASSLVGKSLQ